MASDDKFCPSSVTAEDTRSPVRKIKDAMGITTPAEPTDYKVVFKPCDGSEEQRTAREELKKLDWEHKTSTTYPAKYDPKTGNLEPGTGVVIMTLTTEGVVPPAASSDLKNNPFRLSSSGDVVKAIGQCLAERGDMSEAEEATCQQAYDAAHRYGIKRIPTEGR